MKREAEFFGDREMELVHVSRRLREALAVEDALTAQAVDYLVEADTYRARFLYLFQVDRVGAFFWVPTERAADVRSLLEGKGFTVIHPIPDEMSPSVSVEAETGRGEA